MTGTESVHDKAAKIASAPVDMMGLKVARAAQKRGLIARPLGNILILSPVLVMDEATTDTAAAFLRESIEEVQASLQRRVRTAEGNTDGH